MYKLDIIQIDNFIEKIKNNAEKLMTTESAEHNLLYLNAILPDVKCLIKHYRNQMGV